MSQILRLRNRLNYVYALVIVVLVSGCARVAPQPLSPLGGGEAAAEMSSSAATSGAVSLSVQRAALAAEAPVAVAPSAMVLTGAMQTGGFERKIIGRATVTLIVAEPEAAVTAITKLMDEVGGYVANANLYQAPVGAEEKLQGTLSLRVPAARTDETLARLEALAVETPNKTLNREDVTDQYTDLQAQLRNLEATETELRALLAEVRAKPNARPEDILNVHNHVTSIRGQIDQLRGRQTMLDNLIALATIDVTLTPEQPPAPLPPIVTEDGWQPSLVMRNALAALVGALQGLATTVIWVGLYLLPLALLALVGLGLTGWLIRLILRVFSRRPPLSLEAKR